MRRRRGIERYSEGQRARVHHRHLHHRRQRTNPRGHSGRRQSGLWLCSRQGDGRQKRIRPCRQSAQPIRGYCQIAGLFERAWARDGQSSRRMKRKQNPVRGRVPDGVGLALSRLLGGN